MVGKKLKDKVKNYVIGVDGGATKTAVALADMEGKIVARAISGISNPRNIGIAAAAKNIAAGIQVILRNRKKIGIVSTFIGLPAIEEEFKNKKGAILAELRKNKKLALIFKGEVNIGSDQLVAFRAGTNGKNGIMIIAGTGCVAHGWHNGKEAKASGWGWLLDEGSAFWIGQKTLQSILKSYDNRELDAILERTALKRLKLKSINDLLIFVYKDVAKHLPMFFSVCMDAAAAGDKIAQGILISAGKEIALAGREVAAKLNFQDKVPLVLVGGIYCSRIVLETVKKEIHNYYPDRFEIAVPEDPVAGAVKLARENIKI